MRPMTESCEERNQKKMCITVILTLKDALTKLAYQRGEKLFKVKLRLRAP